MSKGGSSAPTPADPAATAQAQAQSNIATANANRTNMVNPYGASTWGQGPNGVWQQTQTLSPGQAELFGGTQDVARQLLAPASNLASRVQDATGKPLDFSGVNENYLNMGPQALNQRATDASYNAQTAFLDPRFKQQQTDLQDQLSRQGIPLGSQAYNNAETQFDSAKNQAYGSAANTAVGQGQTAANNMFGMALQGQNQNINQQQLAQQNPMKLLSMLYGGQ